MSADDAKATYDFTPQDLSIITHTRHDSSNYVHAPGPLIRTELRQHSKGLTPGSLYFLLYILTLLPQRHHHEAYLARREEALTLHNPQKVTQAIFFRK